VSEEHIIRNLYHGAIVESDLTSPDAETQRRLLRDRIDYNGVHRVRPLDESDRKMIATYAQVGAQVQIPLREVAKRTPVKAEFPTLAEAIAYARAGCPEPPIEEAETNSPPLHLPPNPPPEADA
jgi:hypothetical protein